MAPHDAAVKVLAQGMIDLKLLHGSVDAVIESESYKRFYMHRTGHWLGMDVHDVGEYKTGDDWRAARARHGADRRARLLHPPGRRRARGLPQHRHPHRGRRAGDANGCEILTAAAPKSIADIEALMAEAKS